MKIEIWSDIMCPFCYIGKRRFEKALAKAEINGLEVVYRSFLLDPDLETDPQKNVVQHLSEKKGMKLDEAEKMFRYVTDMAAEEGLKYNLDQAIVANSRNAHRLLHFAKTKNKQVAFKEALLSAYFEEGKNIDDLKTLKSIGENVGLESSEIERVFCSSDYTEDVIKDIQRAQQIGVKGVPFFVFDEKIALSGAQPIATFEEVIQKVRKG